MSTGSPQLDYDAVTKGCAQMRVACANNTVAIMSVSNGDNDLHNMWQIYNAAAWRSSVHEACRDINLIRATCGSFKLAMSEELNQWHLNALR